jgi:hypothetical protein
MVQGIEKSRSAHLYSREGERCAVPPSGRTRSRESSRTGSRRAHLCKLRLRAVPTGKKAGAARVREWRNKLGFRLTKTLWSGGTPDTPPLGPFFCPYRGLKFFPCRTHYPRDRRGPSPPAAASRADAEQAAYHGDAPDGAANSRAASASVIISTIGSTGDGRNPCFS